MGEEISAEIWRTYPEIDFIQGSSLGNMRTIDHQTASKNGRKYQIKGHRLNQYRRPDGYMAVSVSVNGKTVTLKAHRVIAMCFLPNPNNLPEVNHKDCNRQNNVPSNLEWCTNEYNVKYREKHGTPAREFTKSQFCPLFAVNLDTQEPLRFESQHEAARQLGADDAHINSVINGYRNHTHGYWFTKADENTVENTRVKFGNEVVSKISELMEYCQ